MKARGSPDVEWQLWQLMDELAGAGSLEDLYQSALTCLQTALGVERSSILRLDATGAMRFVAWRGLSEGYRDAVDGHSPWDANDRRASPILVPDVRSDRSLAPFEDVLERESIAALAFIPLSFGDKLLGKFMLYYAKSHEFSDDEIAVARIIAGHIAFAIEHRDMERRLEQLLEEEQAARQRAETEVTRQHQLERANTLLLQAGQALSESLPLGETLEALSRVTVPDFADWYVVHLVDDQGQIVPTQIAHADPEKVELAWTAVERWPTQAEQDRGVAATIRTGRASLTAQVTPALLAKLARDPEHLQILTKLGFRSAMTVPLLLPGRVIGAMSLISDESGRLFGADDLAIAQALADRAAVAIDNARLYREAQEARDRAETAANRFDLLARASGAVAGSLDPDTALQQLAQFVVPSLADYCVAYRLAGDETIVRVGLAHADPQRQGLVEELVRAGPPRLDDRFGAGRVIRDGEPVLATDIPPELLAVAAQNLTHLAILRRLGPRSSLIVPLRARGRTNGALALAATDLSGKRYTEADLVLTQELARRTALLIDNARLYAEARAATLARDEMLAVVSHDLRNPLTTIMTASDLLKPDPEDERQVRKRMAIRRAAHQMQRLLEDLLDVTQIDAKRFSVQIERVGVSKLLAELIAIHAPIAEDRGIRLRHRWPELGGVPGDHGRLLQALSNLVGNALKFTPEGGEVSVEAEVDSSALRIDVADTGPGIASEQLPHLFDRFWQQERSNRKGVGLGLTICKGIAEAHGGDVEVTSVVGSGSRFTLVLPTTRPIPR